MDNKTHKNHGQRNLRKVGNLGYLRGFTVLAVLAFFVFRSALEYDRFQLDGTPLLKLKPLSYSFSPSSSLKTPRSSSYNSVSFEQPRGENIENSSQDPVTGKVNIEKEYTNGGELSQFFGQNQAFRLEKLSTSKLLPVEYDLRISDSHHFPRRFEDQTWNVPVKNDRHKFFVKPFFGYGAQSNINLYEMADLQVFEPGTERNSFDAVQMEAFGNRINSITGAGFHAGVEFKNNVSIASGIEMMEITGAQTFIYDIEQKVTGTITRYVPIGGPPGSGPEFMEIEEQRVEKYEIQDTVTARFTYTALFVPLEIGYSKPLNERFEVFAAAQTALQIRARNEMNYESKSLPLQRERSTSVFSGGAFMTFGLSAGLGYNVLPNLTLRAEPSFTTFHNFGSDQNIARDRSRFTAVRTSLVWKW